MAAATLAILAAFVAAPILTEAVAQPRGDGTNVRVLTRNLYLGADLGPATEAANPREFVEANGEILREVDRTNFPLRARALANEIRTLRPHIVGLQEVSLWRTGPPSLDPVFEGPSATDVRYDFLQILLDEINRGRGPDAIRYRPYRSRSSSTSRRPPTRTATPTRAPTPSAARSTAG